MLLTVTTTATTTAPTTADPATDLGYLLHKHPDRAQSFDVSVGTAHVFYPEATPRRCTVALLLDVDPVGLVRGRRGPSALGHYVNDRPYAASSMLAVAMSRVFRTAMSGRCDARPDLAGRPIPIEIAVPALPSRGGPELLSRLFEPLGWTVETQPIPLDETIPAWGDSRYVTLRLTGTLRLADALNHLYVLLPVLDNSKHYWVSRDEVDKLLRAGAGWLPGHPERELISRRYLANQRGLVNHALARLAEVDDTEPEDLDNAVPEDPPERPVPLAEQRIGAVLAALRSAGATRVVDLGCGEGSLIRALLEDPVFTDIVGVDVSARALELATRRLRLDRRPERVRERVRLLQSALTYRDRRLAGFDAAVLMEVIEHVDPPRLPALERSVFAEARPGTVVVTTPNVEYNVRFDWLEPGALRHRDHRFEWTRARFGEWARAVGERHAYAVRLVPVGAEDPEVGPPTQMAVFTRDGAR